MTKKRQGILMTTWLLRILLAWFIVSGLFWGGYQLFPEHALLLDLIKGGINRILGLLALSGLVITPIGLYYLFQKDKSTVSADDSTASDATEIAGSVIAGALAFGWQHMKKDIGNWIVVLICGAVAIFGFGIVMADLYPYAEWIEVPDHLLFGYVSGNIISTLFSLMLTISLLTMGLQVAGGHSLTSRDYYAHRDKVVHIIGAQILNGLIVVLGLILLIIPGIYWSLRFSLYQWCIIEHGCGPIAALKMSRRLTKGHVWELLVVYLLVGCINILGALVIGLGLLATIPTTYIALAYVYKKLYAARTQDVQELL